MKNNSPGEKINPLNTHILLEKKKKKSHDKCEKNLPLFLCFGFTHEERKEKIITQNVWFCMFSHMKKENLKELKNKNLLLVKHM